MSCGIEPQGVMAMKFRKGLKIGAIVGVVVTVVYDVAMLVTQSGKYDTGQLLILLLCTVGVILLSAVCGGASSAIVGAVAGQAIKNWSMVRQKAVEIAVSVVGSILGMVVIGGGIFFLIIEGCCGD